MEKLYHKVNFYYNDSDYINLNVQSIVINSSNDTLTDTCNVIISKLDTYSNSSEVSIQDQSFKLGSKIEIYLGYDDKGNIDNVKKVFIGYLNGFKNNNDTIELNFEDDMYLLKRTKRIKKSYPTGSKLKDIVDKIFTDSELKTKPTSKIIDIDAGQINVINYLLPSEILSMLKERFGIYCYFKNQVLYLGHKYWYAYESTYGITGENKVKTFQFKYPNVQQKPYYKVLDITNLDYNIIDKNDYKVKGTSVYNFTPVKSEYPTGNDPKNIITLSMPDTNKTTLDKLVKERWDNLDKGGFTGSFIIFGYPFVQHGDIVELEIDMSHIKDSPRVIKEKYHIDEIIREFGQNGYHQTLKLGNKI